MTTLNEVKKLLVIFEQTINENVKVEQNGG
jgi:hypothetical protein